MIIFLNVVPLRKLCLMFELVQGGGEAKTMRPKQCIIIDAGLETIKVGGHLCTHV